MNNLKSINIFHFGYKTSYLLKSLIRICLPRYLSSTSSLLLSINLLTFRIAVEWVGLGRCSLVGLALIRLQLLNIQVPVFKRLRFQYIHPTFDILNFGIIRINIIRKLSYLCCQNVIVVLQRYI